MNKRIIASLLIIACANAALMRPDSARAPAQNKPANNIKPVVSSSVAPPAAPKPAAAPSGSADSDMPMLKLEQPKLEDSGPSLNLPGMEVERTNDSTSSQSMNSMPMSGLSTEQLKRKAAFKAMVDAALPMSPDMIKQYHAMLDMTQQAAASTPKPPPTPLASTQHVRLDPGATPPVIRLAAGFVTSMVFLDATGQPWPIENYSIGDPAVFNIQWDKATNTLFVQAQKHYSHGNLAVRLVGENTPVMISLVSGQKEVDYRVDMQVEGRGPNAHAPIITTHLQGSANPLLVNILDGIPPASTRKLKLDRDFGEAFAVGNRMYLRTKRTVISPAWTAKVSSPDGMHVYEMMPTPMVLVSENGQTLSLHIRGF